MQAWRTTPAAASDLNQPTEADLKTMRSRPPRISLRTRKCSVFFRGSTNHSGHGSLIAFRAMRALVLLANLGLLALAFYFGSLAGLLIATALCVAIVAGFFLFSMSRSESLESKNMRRTMGRSTTFLGGLTDTRR